MAEVPALNPYFTLDGNRCEGVWSDEILRHLNKVRPAAQYEELAHTFPGLAWTAEGKVAVTSGPRPLKCKSLKLSNYRLLTGGIVVPQVVP